MVAKMADRDAPEADVYEQEQPISPEARPARLALDDEVPEADALEQSRPVGPEAELATPSTDVEAPEADALEQAEAVVDDEDDERSHSS
jgi:hypothetical protein